MRQQAWDEVKTVLKDYPKYNWYIDQIRFSKLYPYKVTDENIGGGKASSRGDGLERTVISIADDVTIKRLEFQRKAVEDALRVSPEWVEDLITLMFFEGERMSLTQAGELVGKSFRTAKKYYLEFMEEVADNLGTFKGL